MPSTRSGASYNPSCSSQKCFRSDYGRRQSVIEGQGGHIQSQPEGLQQCIAAQRVPDSCISVEKLRQFLPDCKKVPGPSQHLKITQWMASFDGKEKHDAFDSRMERKKPSTTQASAKNSPSSGHRKCISDGQNNDEIAERGGTQTKILDMISAILDVIPNFYIAINDVESHISDKNSSICNNPKTYNLSMNQINETLMCFEKALGTIKTCNNDNSFGNDLHEQSDIIKELTDKYSKFNNDGIIETRISNP
ncbi:hypothetical protein O181_082612 [Austropuccinia psidii MF-1]|uniref:Uncharacterized protein n=1 Tax=Austropuccinia psidii MF-1 TaxID=1389203 RepID=A0A9Q3FSV6_9BASI|nr:hypothetical protein [Austropuccinia psidii MF-1]